MHSSIRVRLAAGAAIGACLATLLLPAGQRLAAQTARERTLYMSVLDGDGRPVTDVRPDEIVVREDNARREVLRVTPAVDPIDLALLVDDSQAMEPNLVHLRPALTSFLALVPQHQVAVIGLAQRPTIFADYTRDPKALAAAVGRVFPQSDSAMTLLDALVETSRGLQKRSAERAVVLAVITDGREHGRYDDRTIIEALQSAGVGFYAVTIGRFTEIQPDEYRYRNIVLQRGTRVTGGRRLDLLVGSGLTGALESVARELNAQLKVVYSRPESLIQPESLEVSVTRAGLTARATPARRTGDQR